MSGEDFGHLADLLRGAMLDQDEATLRALLSNNVNTIVQALKTAATADRRVADMREAREALEFIAEESDTGRSDGLPEPCAAHEADVMWAVARRALTAIRKPPLSDAPEPQGWRDIATAPLTSEARLVWCPERQNIYVVCWNRGFGEWEHFGGSGRGLTEEPTHWQPLPAPPSARTAQDDAGEVEHGLG